MTHAMEFKRGSIFRVNLDPTQGSEQQGAARPCVILSITPLNAKLRQVGVVPLSTSARALPPVVVAVPSAGDSSVALCHQLRTIDKTRIGKHMGELSNADLAAIEQAVRQVYAL
jgi:mRNA interferase MazF